MKRHLLIHNILNKKSQAKGLLGEHLAIQGMRRYTSVQHTAKIGHCGDARIHNTAIEIKTATASKRGEYKACLRKKDKHGYTDFRNSAFVLLQLITNSGRVILYLIPSIVILELKNLCLSANSRKYAQYKVASYKQVVESIKG